MDKGKVAGKAPVMIELEEGKTYAFCTCGESGNQPWCNGAHKGGEFAPKVFKAEETKLRAICTCKQTNNPPYCDGSHNSVAE
jgi:CDGSH-type Zn-finger protein